MVTKGLNIYLRHFDLKSVHIHCDPQLILHVFSRIVSIQILYGEIFYSLKLEDASSYKLLVFSKKICDGKDSIKLSSES